MSDRNPEATGDSDEDRMTDEPPINDDEIQRLLKSLDEDAAPVDESLLRSAVTAASREFESTARPSDRPPQRTTGTAAILAKPLAVLAAAAAVLMVVLLQSPERAAADVTLGAVLDSTLQSGIELSVTHEGQTSQVWVQDGSVRREQTPRQYEIAAGSRLWKVNEDAGTVATDQSRWWQPEARQVDLLALLDARTSPAIRRLLPAGVERRGGQQCHVYEFHSGDLIVRAWATVDTHELNTIAAWSDPQAVKTQPPLSELRLVARHAQLDESLFVVGGALSADGRTGRIVDSQGVVSLRPLTQSRWTPVSGPLLIKPGDWLRTDNRGANAATVELTSGYRLIAGPGSLLELSQPNSVMLHYGEVQIIGSAAAAKPLKLHGPEGQQQSIDPTGTVLYRLNQQRSLTPVTETPVWLAGYQGTSSDESLGSLVATIDGRDTPLTVGFHRVNVEIRDQIARTTIEESFVNHTSSRLEGIFHFPLPQDASISGFGMWIGGELVEADVVEKQRAREIYETILREKRDPGLLEWTGGNIFKARVFPIEANSEKRIKIVYTQVLPLRGRQFRYSYALRSELLRKNPLRELAVNVRVHSALPLKSLDCPTHPVRAQQTAHSGRLEFSAQEYTPERDFEVVCELDTQQSDVVVVPHRRGDDGYFLAQVIPPSADGQWTRDVLSDGAPLNVLLVCDTSGSMDSSHREQQQQFVASVLSALSPQDTFNLALCDVDCQWTFETAETVREKTVTQALERLQQRDSLGWTDLDALAASVVGQLAAGTQVIYIGDGIVTAREADTQAFISRWKRQMQAQSDAVFHAVSVGSSFESAVLQAIASVGGGSVRQTGGEQTPARVAGELLSEITQPGLKNLQVEFPGVQVAAVYPETLPNLAAGTQQIIVGRYLPTGEDQTGQMKVTGTLNGEPVTYVSQFRLQDAEDGNSFVPRLWARAHLDYLLQQGAGSSIREQIIAMSEEFHIITPYTSLLVLESDADRERFGVQRRFLMRDGERFFAAGRDSADFELVQQQMKIAGNWRLGLRTQALRELSGLGRQIPQPIMIHSRDSARQYGTRDFGRAAGAGGQLVRGQATSWPTSGNRSISWGMPVDGPQRFDTYFVNGSESALPLSYSRSELLDRDGIADVGFDFTLPQHLPQVGRQELRSHTIRNRSGTELPRLQERLIDVKHNPAFNLPSPVFRDMYTVPTSLEVGQPTVGFAFAPQPRESAGGGYFGTWSGRRGRRPHSPDYTAWFDQLFPALAGVPAEPDERPESTWPPAALKISKSLVQSIELEDGSGLKIRQIVAGRDPVWDRNTSRRTTLQLYQADQWAASSWSPGEQQLVGWCNEQVRGVWSKSFDLGRVRQAEPRDVTSQTPGQRPYAVTPLHEALHEYDVKSVSTAGTTATVVLTHRGRARTFTIVVDMERNVVRRTVRKADDESSGSATEYSDYVQLAGVWWPQRIRSFDRQNRLTAETTQSVQLLSQAEMTAESASLLPTDDVLLLHEPLPTWREAQIAAESGSPDVDDCLVRMLEAFATQNHDEAGQQLEQLEALAENKPGIAWIRAAALAAMRRNEEARQQLIVQTTALKTEQSEATTEENRTLAVAEYTVSQLQRYGDANERLRLIDELAPVYEGQPKDSGARYRWLQHRVNLLQSLGRVDEELRLRKELAELVPWEVSVQRQYADALHRTGEHAAARSWLTQQLNRPEERRSFERWRLQKAYADLLFRVNAYEELLPFAGECLKEKPTRINAWQIYLSALLGANQVGEADRQALEWIQEGMIPGELSDAQRASVRAAVYWSLGQYYHHSRSRFDPQWLDPLLRAARVWLPHEHHLDLLNLVLRNHHFRTSEQADLLRAEVGVLLQSQAAELPVSQLQSFIKWTADSDTWETEDWSQLAGILRTRWEQESDHQVRRQLGEELTRIYFSHRRVGEYLPFLRVRVQRERDEGEEQQIDEAVARLFGALLSQPWSAEHETEALSLLPQLQAHGTPAGRLQHQVQQLHQLTDSMLKLREARAREKLQAEEHPEELTRKELAERNLTIRQEATEGVLATLIAGLPESAERDDLSNGTLRDWMTAECLYLKLQRNRSAHEVFDECRDLLDALKNPAPVDAELTELTEDDEQLRQLTGQLQQRLFTMTAWLAVQRSASSDQREWLLNEFDQCIADAADDDTTWQTQMIRLLIALDEPEELERRLREWIQGDDYPVAWQLMLARLRAEQGDLEQAVPMFEVVQRRQQLSSSDRSLLADWYMALNRRTDYERCRREAFLAMPEHALQRWIDQQRQRWTDSNQPVPTEMDVNVLFAFAALFEKSQSPGNYVYQLREYYSASRDFRLLQMMPDSVVGRTPQQIYSFLNGLQDYLLADVLSEAGGDEITERIQQLRSDELSTIDQRALDLLETLIENQAARVLNEPGPHEAAAVAALQRAFQPDWADGERLQMARFLGNMSQIRRGPLVDERLRQLRELHGVMEPGTDEHLQVANILGRVLVSHDREQEALAVRSAAMRAYKQSHPDGWPAHMNTPMDNYVGQLENQESFAAAENLLLRHISRPANVSQRDWFRQRRYTTLLGALRRRAQVSLGTGQELFDNIVKLLAADAAEDTDAHRYQTLRRIPQVFAAAKKVNGIAYRGRLKTYAFEEFPKLLRDQQSNYGQLTSALAIQLRELIDTETALEFLVTRMEQYPQRLEIQWQNSWNEHSRQLAEWRHKAGDISEDLQARILKLTLKELRRDLTTRQQSQRPIYGRSHSLTWYWAEQEKTFAAEVESVLRETSSVFAVQSLSDDERPLTPSRRTIVYAAQYLRSELKHFDRAIEIMFIAHSHELLDVSEQLMLCRWLNERNRHAETIPLLEPIVRASPAELNYRATLISAYHHSKRPQQCDQLLSETDEYFRQPGRWTETAIARLGSVCVETGRDEQAVKYFEEVIPLHQRMNAGQNTRNGVLSGYYRQLARACSRLGRTREAVDAASAAVVSWGQSHQGRAEAVNELRQVLQNAEDLDDFVAWRDQQVSESGQDSPLIRKQSGIVYRRKGEYQKAIVQLQQANQLQPGDPETHQILLECYDGLKDTEAAVEQLQLMIEDDRHNLALYQQLAERLKDDPQRSERALTSLVEVDVREAENHQALAELRQTQDRWQDAVVHWQQVARLRSLEPEGLIGLTKAQIHLEAWEDARASLGQLKAREWPGRFSNIHSTILHLQNRIPPAEQ